MKEKFYYFRNSKKEPVITVCILYDEESKELLARGIAICSKRDIPNKKVGRLISSGRAVKAMLNGKDCYPVYRDEALETAGWIPFTTIIHLFSNDLFHDGEYKSLHKPQPTEFEKKLMGVREC